MSSLHLFLLHHFMAIYSAKNRDKKTLPQMLVFTSHTTAIFMILLHEPCMDFLLFLLLFWGFPAFYIFSAFSNTSTQSIFMLFLTLIFPINIILFSLCCLFFSDCEHINDYRLLLCTSGFPFCSSPSRRIIFLFIWLEMSWRRAGEVNFQFSFRNQVAAD